MKDEIKEQQLRLRLLEKLEAHKVLSHCSNKEELTRRAELRVYAQGQKVVSQNEWGDEFFMLMEGQLRAIDVSHTPPKLLNYLSPGDVFGTRALLEKQSRAATIEVITDSTVAVFNKDTWRWLLAENDRFKGYFRGIEQEFEHHARQDFPGKQWDEVVVSFAKRHVLVLLSKMIWPVLWLVVPVLVLILEELAGFTFLDIFTRNLFATILFTVPFIVIAVLLAVYYYLDWRNDDFIVTTKRVVHIERVLFYGEQRHEAPLTRIQDVTVLTFDLIERFFDYHDIVIRTAGAGVIKITGIPGAEEIREKIFQESRRAVERVSAADVSAVRKMIAKHVSLEGAIEEPMLDVAESQVPLNQIGKQFSNYRLPGFLDYFIPRIKEMRDDGNGKSLLWHKHYFILVTATIIPMAAMMVSGYLGLAAFFGFSPFSRPAVDGVWGLLAVLTVMSLVWVSAQYDDWQRDLYVVTDTRIIDIEGTPFRIRGEQRREGTFDNIQNIYYNIPNLFSQLLNMGDVIIETAGTEATFTFEKVFDPSGVQEEIFNRMVLFQQQQRAQMRDATANQVVEYIAEYHHLLKRAGVLEKKG
jgi:hypothetical protein